MKRFGQMVFVAAVMVTVFFFGNTVGIAETENVEAAALESSAGQETKEPEPQVQKEKPLSELFKKKSIKIGKHEDTFVIREVIPFEEETVETEELADGVLEVAQEGVLGEKELVVKVLFTNGEEQSREIIGEKVTQEPVPKITRKGTGKVMWVADTAYSYSQELIMNATAYTSGYESTGKNPGDPGYGVTASGLPVGHGIVSVDPNVIPLGTKLYVEGYGKALAADTGSAIIGHKIDLYYENLSDAYQFGRQNIKVYVLK